MIYAYIQPFRSPADNFNMLVGQVVTFLILFCGLMTTFEVPDVEGYGDTFIIIIICLALSPLLLCIYTIIDELVILKNARDNLLKRKSKRELQSTSVAVHPEA